MYVCMWTGDVGSLILSTPVIRKEWQFIVVSVYKMEGLPVMDGKVTHTINIFLKDMEMYVCM